MVTLKEAFSFERPRSASAEYFSRRNQSPVWILFKKSPTISSFSARSTEQVAYTNRPPGRTQSEASLNIFSWERIDSVTRSLSDIRHLRTSCLLEGACSTARSIHQHPCGTPRSNGQGSIRQAMKSNSLHARTLGAELGTPKSAFSNIHRQDSLPASEAWRPSRDSSLPLLHSNPNEGLHEPVQQAVQSTGWPRLDFKKPSRKAMLPMRFGRPCTRRASRE